MNPTQDSLSNSPSCIPAFQAPSFGVRWDRDLNRPNALWVCLCKPETATRSSGKVQITPVLPWHKTAEIYYVDSGGQGYCRTQTSIAPKNPNQDPSPSLVALHCPGISSGLQVLAASGTAYSQACEAFSGRGLTSHDAGQGALLLEAVMPKDHLHAQKKEFAFHRGS